jgi:PPK2 family polyphosphate:nucleotide phosphotransferase
MKLNIKTFKVSSAKNFSLKTHDPAFKDGFKDKKDAKSRIKKDIKQMSKLQYRLYAENRRSLLIIFQAMDAAGKDSAIKHVLSGINPQGCDVHNFKKPSANELEHGYLWRHYVKLPQRGKIGIFNRSHYENVLVTRVHPEFLLGENLPDIQSLKDVNEAFWKTRFQQINNFEKTISGNGTTIIKFFLHLSKEEQKQRFLARIEDPKKNWKFSSADIEERSYWADYQQVYEKAIQHTSTHYAPWYVIPADNKWFSRIAIGSIIVQTLTGMNIQMPKIAEKERAFLRQAKEKLESDK